MVLFITLISCNNNNDENPFFPITITPVLIGKGNLMGSENISPQKIVLYDNANWNDILNSIDQFRLAQFTETTNVNFNDFQLIAVFDNVYPSPTYEVNITNVTENVNNIVVTVQKTYSPSIATVMTQSFHIVKIPKSTKPIVFQ